MNAGRADGYSIQRWAQEYQNIKSSMSSLDGSKEDCDPKKGQVCLKHTDTFSFGGELAAEIEHQKNYSAETEVLTLSRSKSENGVIQEREIVKVGIDQDYPELLRCESFQDTDGDGVADKVDIGWWDHEHGLLVMEP